MTCDWQTDRVTFVGHRSLWVSEKGKVGWVSEENEWASWVGEWREWLGEWNAKCLVQCVNEVPDDCQCASITNPICRVSIFTDRLWNNLQFTVFLRSFYLSSIKWFMNRHLLSYGLVICSSFSMHSEEGVTLPCPIAKLMKNTNSLINGKLSKWTGATYCRFVRA